MSNCCGKGNVESLLTKFNKTQKTFNVKQHPHAPTNVAAMTTQKMPGLPLQPPQNSKPHPHAPSQLTPNGFLKFMRNK